MPWTGHNTEDCTYSSPHGFTNGSPLSLGRWKGPDLQHELNARLASMALESALGQTEDPKLVAPRFTAALGQTEHAGTCNMSLMLG